MLKSLDLDTSIKFEFSKENLKNLQPFFDIDFPNSSLDEKKKFFQNLRILSRQSLGLAHCIQHNAVPKIIVQLCKNDEVRKKILDKKFDEIIGCWSIVKHSDEIQLDGLTLTGRKKWFSNLDQADFGVMQILDDGRIKLVWFDMATLPHEIDYDFFTPIGMELARPGTLIVNNHTLDPDHILGIDESDEFFEFGNFASYCFLTNHCGITHQLFVDIKRYAQKFKCGAEFELLKLETDVASLVMQWEENLNTLGQISHTLEFWRRRATQYTFSKKTLIRVIQLTLEISIGHHLDAKSEFSQRFRDALTYCSHMHPLCKPGQVIHSFNLEEYK